MNERRLKYLATVIMGILLSACAGQYKSSAGSCDSDTLKAEGQWQEIKAGDIPGNAVELFAKDRMIQGDESRMKLHTMYIGQIKRVWVRK